MPTKRVTSSRQRFSATLGSQNSRVAPVTAVDVLSTQDPAASTGNTVEDHLSDIHSRFGHFTDSEIFKGEYSNSTTYDQGDEVYWVDTDDSRKKFFKRLSDGDDGSSGTPLTNSANWDEIGADIHNIAVLAQPLDSNNDALLFRDSSGAIFFNRTAIATLRAARSEQQVADAINTEIAKVVTNSRWRGAWAAGNFAVGDYVVHSSQYYRCIMARSGSNTSAPNADTTGWSAALSGLELRIAERLEDIETLLANQIDLPTPATGNRGRWMERAPNGEGFQYHLPPMQWEGTWNMNGRYWFGDVVIHASRLWILSAAAAITASKTGSATAPGTDSDWTEISIGHTADVPGFRGSWGNLNGQALRVGDVVENESHYFIVKVAHTVDTSGSGPAADRVNFDLLDNWAEDYAANGWYHEGTIVKHDGEIWIAEDDVSRGDPEPGDNADSKWRQITGATQADLDQLRRDIEALGHGAVTTRGVLVSDLQEAPNANSPPLVWLPRKRTRMYTAPAALINGNSDRTTSVGDEAGEYALTQGTVNRFTVEIGLISASGECGAFARGDDGLPVATVGKVLHSPLGSAVAGVGQVNILNNRIRYHLFLKANVAHAIFGDTLDHLWLAVFDADGTRQTDIRVGNNHTYTLGDVQYLDFSADSGAGVTGLFRTLYDAGTDAASRTVTVGVAASDGGDLRWLGNRTYGWTRQPPISSHDDIPVYSEDAHTIKVETRSNFLGRTGYAPRTLYFTYGS